MQLTIIIEVHSDDYEGYATRRLTVAAENTEDLLDAVQTPVIAALVRRTMQESERKHEEDRVKPA